MKPLKEMKVTSPFGEREAPIKGASTYHSGVDLSARYVDAFAIEDGIVNTVAEWEPGIGKYIIIKHDGFYTTYGHLDSFNVIRGQNVRKGDKIAVTGNSGNSQAPHLHFEVRKCDTDRGYWTKPNGTYYKDAVDPIKFIEESKPMTKKQIQELLNKDGANLIVDGKIGPATRNAIKVFQKRYGLVADGNAGPKTQAELYKVSIRKFSVNYYDKQTMYILYKKSDVKEINLINANKKQQASVFMKSSTADILFNGTMFNMPTGDVLGEVFDEGKRHGYNPYDPLTFVIRRNGVMAFMDQSESRKLKDIKDAFSFSPQMFINGSRAKTYGNNLPKSFITTSKEPRNGFFETKDYYINVFVNGRLPIYGFNGVTIPRFFQIVEDIGKRIGQPILNGGNLDSGYSLMGYVKGVLRTNTGVTNRAIANMIEVYF